MAKLSKVMIGVPLSLAILYGSCCRSARMDILTRPSAKTRLREYRVKPATHGDQ